MAGLRVPCPKCGYLTRRHGECTRCYTREIDRDRAPPRTQPQPVDPVAVAWLSELRRAAGPGACVVVSGKRVIVDRVGHDRLVFSSIDEALDYFTRAA